MNDLWPKEIETVRILTPYTIVKEQGTLLGKKTQNLVYGDVATIDDPKNYFSYVFRLVSTPISYKYNLFYFSHKTDIYPVRIKHPDAPYDAERLEVDNEEEFIDILKKIFASEETKRIIALMLSQAKG